MKLRETWAFWILGISLCASDESAKLGGDVMIGGLFKIFDLEEGSCSTTVDTASVRDFEAAKWTLNQLNEANYIPGVKIGIEAYSTCDIPGRAVYHTMNFVQRAIENNGNITSLPITGILGPETSSEVQDTSAFISSLPKEYQLYQFIFSATSSNLNDEIFSNIVRVIPNDKLQTKVMKHLLEQLEWNYIAVVYENTTYGRRAFQELSQNVKISGICIANAFPVQIGNSENVDLNALQSVLDNLLYNAESQITGVIFFVSTSTAGTFLNIARGRKLSLNFRLMMVFSESIALEKSLLAKYDTVSKGSFVTSPAVLKVEQFQNHWKDVLSNKTTFLRESVSNPWLLDVFRKYKSCRPIDDSCVMPAWQEISMAEDENIFESYAIVATLLHLKGIKELYSEKCGSANGICNEFRNVLQKNKNLLLRKTQNVISFDDLPFSFDKNVSVVLNGESEVLMRGDIPEYEVYHYRRCLLQPDNFCMEKVAEYDESSLKLYKERLADYSSSVELHWPNLYKAQCFPGKKCESCLFVDPENDFIFQNGDLFIIGMAPINNADLENPFQCGAIRETNGWETAQAISYAFDDVNTRKDVFPNTTIGYIILNSCNQPVLTTKKLLDIFSKGLIYKNETIVKDLLSRVLAVVAELGSSISQAAAKVLQEFNIVQVAYGSTATVLSDKSQYKYFLRLSTPDTNQAKAMVNILKLLNSSYIQILYSEGTYGEGGRDEIVRVAKSLKVCVANEIKVVESTYSKILDDLRRKPYAQIVLLFLKSHIVTDVVNVITGSMKSTEFMFIASEAFGTNNDIIQNNPKLEGSISMSLEISINRNNLRRYIFSKSTENYNSNPWTRSYFESKYKCYLPGSFDKSMNKECGNLFEQYNLTDYEFNIWSPFALSAAEVALKGTYAAFNNSCGPKSQIICPNYKNNPENIWESIRQQKLNLDGTETSVFDENGDGSLGHVIYQIQKSKQDPQKLTFVKIGRFDNSVNFTIDKEHLINPFQIFPTKCPNPIECNNCTSFFEGNSKIIQQTSGNDSDKNVVIGLAVAVAILVIISTVLFVLILRKGLIKTQQNDNGGDHYMTTMDMPEYLTVMK